MESPFTGELEKRMMKMKKEALVSLATSLANHIASDHHGLDMLTYVKNGDRFDGVYVECTAHNILAERVAPDLIDFYEWED